MKTNQEILEEIHTVKNHQWNTQRKYKYAVQKYCKFQKKHLWELIEEAEREEEQGIRWKNRRLKNRLIRYRQYLYDNYAKNTVDANFIPILVIYDYFEIEIHKLPKISSRSITKPTPIRYKDLPDKEVIRAALEIASPLMKAIILFISSSGSARRETLNLTIQDYMKATQEYHQTNNINEMIETLNKQKDVVPTFDILRAKTNKYYTTYCSPEAVTAINHYLLSRVDPLTPESKLFKIAETTFVTKFEEINDKLELGFVGSFRRFRSHMLRKFHATTLYNDGMALDKINDMQGKSKNSTDSVYFMTNPEDLKLEYIEHLPVLTMGKDVEKVTVKSPEFLKLENTNRELEASLKEQESKYENILERISALENRSNEDVLAKFKKRE